MQWFFCLFVFDVPYKCIPVWLCCRGLRFPRHSPLGCHRLETCLHCTKQTIISMWHTVYIEHIRYIFLLKVFIAKFLCTVIILKTAQCAIFFIKKQRKKYMNILKSTHHPQLGKTCAARCKHHPIIRYAIYVIFALTYVTPYRNCICSTLFSFFFWFSFCKVVLTLEHSSKY